MEQLSRLGKFLLEKQIPQKLEVLISLGD